VNAHQKQWKNHDAYIRFLSNQPKCSKNSFRECLWHCVSQDVKIYCQTNWCKITRTGNEKTGHTMRNYSRWTHHSHHARWYRTCAQLVTSVYRHPQHSVVIPEIASEDNVLYKNNWKNLAVSYAKKLRQIRRWLQKNLHCVRWRFNCTMSRGSIFGHTSDTV